MSEMTKLMILSLWQALFDMGYDNECIGEFTAEDFLREFPFLADTEII